MSSMQTAMAVLPAQKTIALVAHDNLKPAMIEWCISNTAALKRHRLVATGTTGGRIQEATGLEVRRLLSGPLGGDQQIGAMISEGQVDVLIFFWDPLEPMPHDMDVKALLRIAALWNIPAAYNSSSADMLIASALMEQSFSRTVPARS